ncbi:MAG: citramalate synthase [Hydrotalea sp.]|nr:citramalate synthase [Hydrotalea sp.]
MTNSDKRVYIFDTTLRDGAQTQGVNFTLHDKMLIAGMLDELAVDYIEGGFPGANPTDDELFAKPPVLKNSSLVAFGMTRRAGVSADNDPGLRATINSRAGHACLVAKSWDKQIEQLMGITLDENLAMIQSSIKLLLANKKSEIMLDAEHFFDGFLSNEEYAMRVIATALDAGARWVVLCDTRGAMLPHDIEKIISAVGKKFDLTKIGIHAHNDGDCAVANSLAAVRLGVRQVQGTLNGLGERCGNANILSLMADLHFKMKMDIGPAQHNLHLLTRVSRQLDELLARAPNPHLPFVGTNAFAHKGGLHGAAVMKDAASYEHISPESVGNERVMVMSDQSGKSNLRWHLQQLHLTLPSEEENLLLANIKDAEFNGLSFDGAEASLDIFIKRHLRQMNEFFSLSSCDINYQNQDGESHTTASATISVDGKKIVKEAVGNGPVNALDAAMRQALVEHFPQLAGVQLVDYKVRIIPPSQEYQGTAALTRVMIESTDGQKNWTTVGVSSNIIAASESALTDAYRYYLMKQ